MANIINVVLTGNVSPLTAALSQGAAQLGAFGRRANELGRQSAAAAQQANRLGSQAEAAASRVSRLGSQADAASAAAARLRAQADAGGAGAARLGQQADAAAARAARLRAEAAAAGAAAGQLGAQAQQAADRARRLGEEAERASVRAQRLRLGMQVAAAGGALLAAGLGAAVLSAVSFEAKMRQVSSIDDSVKNNFEEMSQAVLDLAKELPQSADVLAEGLYNIAGSGFYGAEALNILEISAKAASAGMTTTDNSAKAIVATLNAYGLGAESAARVSDALFNTVNYGVLSYEELTGAVAHFIGNSAAAGVSIEEAGAALATMTLSGLSASEAGVSLNNMLSKLIKPSQALAGAASQLGISLEADLKNPAIGLHGVMMQLMEASGGNLKTLLQWFPEIRAARGALALMSAEGENYTRVFAGMGTATANAGATQNAYNEVAKSTAHQFETLRGSVESTAIEIGLKLLPYVNQAIAGLTGLGGEAKSLASEVAAGLAPGFRDWGQAVGDVVSVLDQLQVADLVGLAARIGIGALVTGFNALGTAVSSTTGFVSDHVVAVEALAAAWLVFNAARIVSGLSAIGVAIAHSIGSAIGTAQAALVTLQNRLTAMGNGNMWRGLLLGTAATAVVTASIYAVVDAFGEMKKAKQDLANVRLSVSDIVAEVNPTTLTSYQTARERLEGMAASAQRAVLAARDLGGLELGEALAHYGRVAAETDAALDELARTEQYAAANIKLLSQEYGISEAAVVSLAEKYDINLTQALDAAGEGGTTLRDAFQLIANEMTAAGMTAEEVSASMEALGIAAGGTDKAVESLTATLNFMAGTGIATQLAVNQMEIALLDLAEGANLTGTALQGTSREALNNQNAFLAYAQTGLDAAIATTKMSGSVEDGLAVWQEFVPRLRAAGVAADLSASEIDTLIESVNAGNAIAGIDVPVTAPGLPETTQGVQELTRVTSMVPPGTTTFVQAPGLVGTTSQFNDLNRVTSMVPPGTSTAVTAPGLVGTTSGFSELNRVTSMVPPGTSTFVQAPGLVGTTGDFNELNRVTSMVPGQVSTSVETPGLTSAVGAVDGYIRLINGIPRNVQTYFTNTVNTVQVGTTYGGPLPTGATRQGRASGGPVRGPGTGTSDSVPIMASDGEWVIKASAARRYGPDLMAALNSGQAMILPRYARGGPVGHFAAGGEVAAGGAGTGGSGATGATGAIELVERGGATLADVYRQTAGAVGETTDALRAAVPRLWEADRHTGYLAATTGLADQATGLFRDTLATATEGVGLATVAGGLLAEQTGLNTLANTDNMLGLQLLGAEVDLNNTERAPLTLLNTQAQTLATTEGTLADTANLEGQLLLGAEADLTNTERAPLTLVNTQAQTLATTEGTLADTARLEQQLLLGVETDLNNTERFPLTLASTQAQTLAQTEGTLADTEHLLGMQLLGVETDLNTSTRFPAVLLGTQTQTLATQESTVTEAEHLAGLTVLGAQWDLASGTQLPTLTAATDTQTAATDLHTAATVLQTGALVETTAASGQTTTALGTQTTATNTATTATNTATTAANTFTTSLGAVAAAANTAAGAVNGYVAALNSIPPDKTTTITTNFVTTGTPAPGAQALPVVPRARGGLVTGPGTATSDSILAALSAGEWVIRASAAAAQGPYRMAMLNAGLADVVPRFASGGQVPGFASGGMVRPASARPVAMSAVVVNNTFETSVSVTGGGDAAATARLVRGELDAALSGVAGRIRAGVGRR